MNYIKHGLEKTNKQNLPHLTIQQLTNTYAFPYFSFILFAYVLGFLEFLPVDTIVSTFMILTIIRLLFG